jgi:predicted nucleic acid-binding protein
MSIIVLDTDVWSFLFKADSRAEHYRPYLEDNVLCISFQTVAELYQWIETASWGEKRREKLHQWLRHFQVLGYDDATALAACRRGFVVTALAVQKRLKSLLQTRNVPFSDNLLVWARIRSAREKQGRPLSAQDAWVAACTLRHGSMLLTHNASDYEGIQDLDVVTAGS